jgi:hypothetical protein
MVALESARCPGDVLPSDYQVTHNFYVDFQTGIFVSKCMRATNLLVEEWTSVNCSGLDGIVSVTEDAVVTDCFLAMTATRFFNGTFVRPMWINRI